MKTLNKLIIEKNESPKVWAVVDFQDVMYNFFYTKEEADDLADELNKKTPSLKYKSKQIDKSELEKTYK